MPRPLHVLRSLRPVWATVRGGPFHGRVVKIGLGATCVSFPFPDEGALHQVLCVVRWEQDEAFVLWPDL